MAADHKKFYRIQHPEICLLDLKVQYKHKIKLPLDMVSKHVFLYLCLPDYNTGSITGLSGKKMLNYEFITNSYVLPPSNGDISHQIPFP